MQEFSNALVEIYEAAESLNIADFPVELLRLLRKKIAFDGAVLGTGGRAESEQSLVIDDAFIDNRDKSILIDYAAIATKDPITEKFVAGLTMPLAIDCKTFYQGAQLEPLLHFTQRHDIGQLMLHGNQAKADGSTKWMVLYRSTKQRFSDNQAMTFGALWPHISRALSTNRIATVDATRQVGHEKAVALINSGGGIEFADNAFRALIALEWNIFPTRTLPSAIMMAAFSPRGYEGSCIRIFTTIVHGYYVSRAEPYVSTQGLSRSESVIAASFAQGLTYKEIGKQLGLSQHTVRVHLANCYRKLGAHNKVALRKLLGL